MTDKKLTESEIVKLLECCKKSQCSNCEYSKKCDGYTQVNYALDLITRQQAEIENLKVENQSLRGAANSLKMHYEEAQAEIERLRKEVNLVSIQFQDLQERYEEAQAEIERLNAENMLTISERNAFRTSFYDVLKQLKIAKSEVVKEFAYRLKEFMHNKFKALDEYEFEYITERDIDNLVKEMAGENNG